MGLSSYWEDASKSLLNPITIYESNRMMVAQLIKYKMVIGLQTSNTYDFLNVGNV